MLDAYDQKRMDLMLKKRHITESGCWEWTGAIQSDGYGRIGYGIGNSLWYVHCLMLKLTRPDEFHAYPIVLHTCDNRKCINPDHLKGGTQSENLRDAFYKGRLVLPKHGEERSSRLPGRRFKRG